jgi:hypothetical protein
MNHRRFVLHLIIGLLTFLIGVTAAIALGGFDPLERFSRHGSHRQLTIPPQPLINQSEMLERNRSCNGLRRTADLRYRSRSLTPPPPPPAAPVTPFDDESEAIAPTAPSDTR